MHAHVHASGDESLDLHALPDQVVLVIPITLIRCDASSVPKGGDGLILHGVLGSREDVAPGTFTLSQGFVQLSQKKLSRVGRERRDEACEGSISARVVFCHDELVRDPKGVAEVVDHGHMMRLATKAGSAMPSAVRRPSPPQETPVVACHQEWSGKSPLSEALTDASNCPSKATSRSLSSMSSLTRMWYMSLETSAHCLVRTICERPPRKFHVSGNGGRHRKKNILHVRGTPS